MGKKQSILLIVLFLFSSCSVFTQNESTRSENASFISEEVSTNWKIDTFGCLGLRKALPIDTLLLGETALKVIETIGPPFDSSGSSVRGAGNWIYFISTDFCEYRDEGYSPFEYGGMVLELRMKDGVISDTYYSVIN